MGSRLATEPPLWAAEVERRIVDQANWIASWLGPQTGITVQDVGGTTIGANVVASELFGIPWDLFMGASPYTRGLPVVGEDGQLVPDLLYPPVPTLSTGLARFSELLGVMMPGQASDSARGGRMRWISLSTFPLKVPSTHEVIGALCAFTREPDGHRLRRARNAVLDTYHELVDGGHG